MSKASREWLSIALRRRCSIVLLGMLILGATGFGGWWFLYSSGVFTTVVPLNSQGNVTFPQDNDVETVTATIISEMEPWLSVPEFTLPPEYVPVILQSFRPAREFPNAGYSKCPRLCSLKIVTKLGKV